MWVFGGNKKLKLDHVHFIDFLKKEELLNYYKVADIFVLPTRGNVWGLVINEAMACGLPIITTDKCVDGLELIKNNENGFLVPIEDEQLLAEKINVILNDMNLQRQMSINNLHKIKRYTIENMTERHYEVLNNM